MNMQAGRITSISSSSATTISSTTFLVVVVLSLLPPHLFLSSRFFLFSYPLLFSLLIFFSPLMLFSIFGITGLHKVHKILQFAIKSRLKIVNPGLDILLNFSNLAEEHVSKICAMSFERLNPIEIDRYSLGQTLKILDHFFLEVGKLDVKGKLFGFNISYMRDNCIQLRE